jgi:hypothetical protein
MPDMADTVFCALAHLPDLGAAFALNGEGEALLRLSLDPASVAGLTDVLQALRNRTFYVALVATPKGARHAREDEGAGSVPESEPQAEETPEAEGPRPRRRRRVPADKPDRRTH